MGFDNDCILDIRSVAPEYFCPVCRTLVYPSDALHTQCSHLYCKPCLVHIASGTQTCPYDGKLVTVAGSKPVIEIDRILVEAIGKIAVRCLYHRSGCMWQGPLSECIVHRSGCAFGDSQVICIKCQIQIAHRQAEEHAQICNVNQVMIPEAQQVWDAATSTSQRHQPQCQQVCPEMAPYSLQATQPFNQPHFQVQGPAQSQARPQISFSGQHGPHLYPHAAMPAPNGTQAQLNPQQQIQPEILPHVQIQTQNQLLAYGHMPLQLSSQARPHADQGHAQQHMQVPQFQQSLPQVHHPQPYLGHPDSQLQSQPHAQGHPQSQSCPQVQHPHIQQILQAPPQQHPCSQQVLRPLEPSQRLPSGGHAPWVPPAQQHIDPHSQQVLQAPPQQHPHSQQVLNVPPQQGLRPLEPSQRLPSQGQTPEIPPSQQRVYPHSQPRFPVHQHPVICQVQQPLPQQHVQLPQLCAGYTSGPLQGQLHHAGPFAQEHSQAFPGGPPQLMYHPSLGGAVVEMEADQALGRTTKQQELKPQTLKNSGMDANGLGANLNEKRPGANANEEHKPENGGGDSHKQDEAVIRDAVPKHGGNMVQNEAVDVRDVPAYSVKQGAVKMNVQTPTHFQLAEHGHFSNPGEVSNLAECFHPPGPNQSGSFYPQDQLRGFFSQSFAAMLQREPNNSANHARSFEPQYEGFRRPYSHSPPYGPPGLGSSLAPRPCYEQTRAPIGKHPDAFQMEAARLLDQGLSGQQRFFGDSSGAMSAYPYLGGPGSQSSYICQGFPNAGPFCAGGSDSFDDLRKRKSMGMGWCRICKVDCESVKGLQMHGQTCEHQRMALNMVNDIKQKSARIAITSNAHSGPGEASKLGRAGSHACGSKP